MVDDDEQGRGKCFVFSFSKAPILKHQKFQETSESSPFLCCFYLKKDDLSKVDVHFSVFDILIVQHVDNTLFMLLVYRQMNVLTHLGTTTLIRFCMFPVIVSCCFSLYPSAGSSIQFFNDITLLVHSFSDSCLLILLTPCVSHRNHRQVRGTTLPQDIAQKVVTFHNILTLHASSAKLKKGSPPFSSHFYEFFTHHDLHQIESLMQRCKNAC